jgi:hypothetical protein
MKRPLSLARPPEVGPSLGRLLFREASGLANPLPQPSYLWLMVSLLFSLLDCGGWDCLGVEAQPALFKRHIAIMANDQMVQ